MDDICPLCSYSIKADAISLGMDYHLGCNAEPLAEGQCCETCDRRKVVPARLAQVFGHRNQDDVIAILATPRPYDGRSKVARRRKHSDLAGYTRWHSQNIKRQISP